MRALVPKRKMKTKGRRIPRDAFHLEVQIDTENLKRFLLSKLKEEKVGT